MSKKQKKATTEITKPTNVVGNLVKALSHLPDDVEVCDDTVIKMRNPHTGDVIAITPSNKVTPADEKQSTDYPDNDIETLLNPHPDDVIDRYLYGLNAEKIQDFRHASAGVIESIYGSYLNEKTLDFEKDKFTPEQYDIVAGIRHDNAVMAEAVGEMARRITAGLLEYNLEASSMLNHATMKSMCNIIDKKES